MTTATKQNQADQRVAMRWIPKDSRKIEHEMGVCYTEDKLNTPRNIPIFTVMGYIGTARKSAFYESYRTAEARDKRVTDFFAGLESHAVMMAERKVEREKPHQLNVGEVIYNSWGYDQTNVDFYVIVKATANYVWLQPIACESVPSEGCSPMSGYAQPEQPIRQILAREVSEWGEYNEATGYRARTFKTVPIEPEKRKAEGRSVHFEHGSGSVWDGRPKYESWYA
jgi:hypothetical protein